MKTCQGIPGCREGRARTPRRHGKLAPPRVIVPCVLAVLALGIDSCAGLVTLKAPAGGPLPPAPDSLTVGVWHMDEADGDRIMDAGSGRLDGVAGSGATAGTGVSGAGREFTGDPDAFVLMPWKPALRGMGALTVEAWIRVAETSTGGFQTIAAQWMTHTTDSGWYFGLFGEIQDEDIARAVFHRKADLSARHLVFIYASARAGTAPRMVVSQKPIVPGIWTHVAVTCQAGQVRFYRDRKPDWDISWESEHRDEELHLTGDSIQETQAPLTLGCILTSLVSGGPSGFTYSTARGTEFEGAIDELRISRGARTDLASGR